jgi:hypothetical protein
MSSRNPSAQGFDDLVALTTTLIAIAIGVLPWLLLFLGGWRLLLRWYLIPYPFVLIGFAIIMLLFNRREILARVQKGRAPRESE